jgi:hypothetical protein
LNLTGSATTYRTVDKGGTSLTLSPEKIADLRVKELEMIQVVIGRLGSYGATLKNYCITLATAICGFAFTSNRPLAAAPRPR